MSGVQEVLSRDLDSKAPLGNQELYELRPYSSDSAGKPVYCLRESHVCCDGDLGFMELELKLLMLFESLAEANEQYKVRRRILAQQGFTTRRRSSVEPFVSSKHSCS